MHRSGRHDLVFEALTKPEHVRPWWAPRSLGVELVKCEIERGGRTTILK